MRSTQGGFEIYLEVETRSFEVETRGIEGNLQVDLRWF